MADSNTPNYNLVKPGGDSLVDISAINGNMDIIDEALGDLGAQTGRFDLLLTNSSSTPAGTVVSYPSGKYDAIGVMIRSGLSGPTSGLFIIPIGESANCDVWQSETSWQRTFSAGATSLTCTSGTSYRGWYSTPAPAAGGSIEYGDGYAIPYKVWGIKF